MGAINSAFNQGLGSVAAAATLIKGAKEKDMSQALLGKEQYIEAEAGIKEDQAKLPEAKNKLGEAEADLAILNAKRTGAQSASG